MGTSNDAESYMRRALELARIGAVTPGAAAGSAELRGATLYTTLQPCGMCSMAVIWSKIDRIVFGAGRADVHAVYFEERHLDTVDFIADAFRDDLVMSGGVLRDECAALYYRPADDLPREEQGNL